MILFSSKSGFNRNNALLKCNKHDFCKSEMPRLKKWIWTYLMIAVVVSYISSTRLSQWIRLVLEDATCRKRLQHVIKHNNLFNDENRSKNDKSISDVANTCDSGFKESPDLIVLIKNCLSNVGGLKSSHSFTSNNSIDNDFIINEINERN